MWVATPRGFYSAVAHRDKKDMMLIRARSWADLDNLATLAKIHHQPVGRITQSMKADYPWRLNCTRLVWQVLLMVMADEIDYDNFKTKVAETNEDRADTYHRVWATLMAIEHEPTALGAGVNPSHIRDEADDKTTRCGLKAPDDLARLSRDYSLKQVAL